MKTLIFTLFFAIGSAYAAAPTATISCNRTSGAAPLTVICESGGADADESRPFHTLLNTWNFGDTGAGNWAYGANTSLSKNGATGPVAAHLYETAGTYTITVRVCDATTCAIDTETITVTDISAANTVCVGVSAEPVAGSNGCPTSSNVAQKSDGDFDAMLTTQLGASSACGAGGCKRILLQCGEAWLYSTNTTVSASGAGLIGKFGTCAAPTVTGTANANALTFGANDWRVSGLSFIAFASATTAQAIVTGASEQITVTGASFSGFNYGINATSSSPSEVGVFNSSFANAVGTSYGIFITVTNYGAVLGNLINIGTGGTHGLRSNGCDKCVFSNNTAYAASVSAMLIHGYNFTIASQYTQKIVYSDNKIMGAATGTATGPVAFNPQNTTSDERIRDVIVERNWCVAGAVQNDCIGVEAVDVTLRNNIFNITGGNAKRGVTISNSNTSVGFPKTTRVNAYNNTGYDSAGSTDFVVIRYFTNLDGTCTATAANNLGYAPGSSNGVTIQNGGSCVVTLTTNSNNTQTRGTDPQFTGATTAPIGFQVATTSYAADGGTADFPATSADFFNCTDKSGDIRIGAVVQQGQAQCRGVAQ